MYPRFVKQRMEEALSDTRVVILTGPRQSGKTTLVRHLFDQKMPFFTLDNATTLDAAAKDPVKFIRNLDRAIIDEVQRAPGLLLAIKESVDNDQRPGRFLLTGSANLMTLPKIADSLAGRMEMVRLFPLAQSEVSGTEPSFLSIVFRGEAPPVNHPVIAEKLMETVLSGGYPEAIKRRTLVRQQNWYLNYLDALIHRDVQDITLEKLQRERRLFGPLLETFVLTELIKLSSWHTQELEFFHYRDKEKNKVDIIMQNRGGQIVGVEVKASATVTNADFSGLRKLAKECEDRFTLGLVLYDHDKIIPFGERLYAVPVSALWQ